MGDGKKMEETEVKIILTTAIRVSTDFPSVPILKLLNRCRASCASPEFAKLVPPRSSEDSKSKTVNAWNKLNVSIVVVVV